MLLQDKQNGALVEILDTVALTNPADSHVPGRIQSGEEEQEPETFDKHALIFPSGESLPQCWMDAEYRAKT
ncbi:MAG: acetyltransferase [Leptolyngbyaceae cyanobacterium CRU_2_3]|nr:acetyltransferase [Leptolyngbyaceae cyanobacterium CRU_2_3]